MFRTYEAQKTWNQRLLERGVAPLEAELAASGDTLAAFMSDITGQTIPRGEMAFQRGRTAIAQAAQQAAETAKTSLSATAGMIDRFRTEANTLRLSVGAMRGEVLKNAKSNTAILLSQASEGIRDNTERQIADSMAEMRAQGVPEAQVRNHAAQISATGQATLGNMLQQIGAAENQRLSDLEVSTGQWVADAASLAMQGTGEVIAEGMRQTGETFRNLTTTRASLAEATANLEQQHADWRASISGIIGDVQAAFTQLRLAGRVDVANLLTNIVEPVVAMGPILEGTLDMALGLEDLDYQYRVGTWSMENAIDTRMWDTIQASLNRGVQVQQQERAIEAQEEIASRNRIFGLAGSITEAGGSVAGGFAAKPGKTPAAPTTPAAPGT
jgi:hypothetical protein